MAETTNAFRAPADELQSSCPAGRVRSHASLHDEPRQERRVAEAVARATDGDREASRFLYMRYADNVYGYVRSIVRDDHDAEDVTQHAFARIEKSRPSVHGLHHRGRGALLQRGCAPAMRAKVAA